MRDLFWYCMVAGLGVAFLAAFRALVEEYVLKSQLDVEAQLKGANAPAQAQPDGVTMKDVRAHREAYRQALAGGLRGGAAKPAPPPEPREKAEPSRP